MSTIYSNISTKMSGAGSLGGGASRGGGGAWMGGTYAAGGSGLGLGSAAGLGAGLGTGIGLGAGLGVGGYAGGIGVGLGGSGLSLACGSGPGLGLGLANYGGAGAGAGMISPAFTMGRTFAAGGLSGSSALAIGPSLGPSLAPVLSRQAEKQLLSGLNERFSTYMIKVRALQQENMALEANLSQLTGGTDMSPETSTSTIEFEAQISEYRNTLEKLTMDTIKLEVDLDNVRGAAHELKAKFDFEQGVRYQLEADITAMKKDTEMAGDLRVELDAKYGSLKNELDYVTKTQEEELASLQAKLGTTTVDTSVSMIEVDTGNSFDISSALNSIREDYEKTVQRHREEADAYYKIKMEEIQSTTAKNTEAISSAKVEIAGAKKDLQGLGLELQTLLTVNMTLAARMAEAQAQSTVGVADYQSQMASIAGAIDMAKVELQKQILSYQELLDIKLALDVEISTYRKLLEGSDLHVSDSPFHSGTYTFTVGETSKISLTELSATSDAEETEST